ncbi:hypothetical protein D9M69_715160 [compost metagenome]
MPEASDFLDPQKTRVISFSLDKPSLRAPHVVTSKAVPSSKAFTSTMAAMSIAGNACQIPCATASLNAV